MDIDNLASMKNYFQDHGFQPKRLFHLLGLTLGNNKEYELLRNISKGMSEGDYLLLGVDFCLNRNEWYTESIQSYEKTKHAIMNFLSGPLLMSLQVEKNFTQSEILRFFGQMPKSFLPAEEAAENTGENRDYYDYVTNGINVNFNEVKEVDGMGLSDIESALSLARFYTDVNITKENFNLSMVEKGEAKLFDYSNKYDSHNFVRFLRNRGSALHLKLVETDVMRWGKGSQHLVLLKKDTAERGIVSTTAIPRLTDFLRNNLINIKNNYEGTNLHQYIAEAKRLIPKFEGNDFNYGRIKTKIINEKFHFEEFFSSDEGRINPLKGTDTGRILREIKKMS
jgi:hypothetical protein